MMHSFTEYGILCDRTAKGLGKVLLGASKSEEHAWRMSDSACRYKEPHTHLLVKRYVTQTDWSDPLVEEDAGWVWKPPDDPESDPPVIHISEAVKKACDLCGND